MRVAVVSRSLAVLLMTVATMTLSDAFRTDRAACVLRGYPRVHPRDISVLAIPTGTRPDRAAASESAGRLPSDRYSREATACSRRWLRPDADCWSFISGLADDGDSTWRRIRQATSGVRE